ncbi:MAG: YdcF family protein [Pseudomonadota bacterium]
MALIFIAGFLPLGHLLLLPLEERFAPWQPTNRSPAGIIVLGGASETPVTLARGQLSLNESAERMSEGVMLARRYPSAKLVFTGGDGGLLGGHGNESDDAENLFVRLGVPRSQLVLERNSRNTYENAGLVAKAVQPKAGEVWLLVTSAWHMPRAVGCFRRAGFNVTPYPVDYRTRGWSDIYRPFGAVSEGLRRTDIAVKEWTGLLVYRWLGYTGDIFPGV